MVGVWFDVSVLAHQCMSYYTPLPPCSAVGMLVGSSW